jgi:AAA ATPase domain
MTNEQQKFDIPIIAIHGHKGSGKSYYARQVFQFLVSNGTERGDLINEREVSLLVPYLGRFAPGRVTMIAFADLLKEILVAQGKATLEEVLRTRKTREYRNHLIDTATNLREIYGQSFFANALCTRMLMSAEKNGSPTVFIIDDLREEHEEQALLQFSSQCLLCTVNAPRRSADTFQREANGSQQTLIKHTTHSSETGLNHKTCDRATAESNGYHFVDNDYRF